MVRTACFDKSGKRKGAWSSEEDNKLRDYIQRYGHWNWRELPKYAGLSRCGKSCRLRWMNYLKPDVKRGNYTKEEDDIIINLYAQLGSKWSLIAAKLPGRTDNDIKNHWHTHLKKRTKQGRRRPVVEDQSTIVSSHREQSVEGEWGSESRPQSVPSSSSSDAQEPSQPSSSEPSNCSELSPTCLSGMKWAAEDSISSLESFAEPIGMNFWTEPFLADTCYYQFDFSSSSSLVDSDFMFPEFSTYDAAIGLPCQLMQEF